MLPAADLLLLPSPSSAPAATLMTPSSQSVSASSVLLARAWVVTASAFDEDEHVHRTL
jgi:hypothetical protein